MNKTHWIDIVRKGLHDLGREEKLVEVPGISAATYMEQLSAVRSTQHALVMELVEISGRFSRTFLNLTDEQTVLETLATEPGIGLMKAFSDCLSRLPDHLNNIRALIIGVNMVSIPPAKCHLDSLIAVDELAANKYRRRCQRALDKLVVNYSLFLVFCCIVCSLS